MSWVRAAALSLGVVVIAYVILVLVPDYLVSTLSGRVAPALRDLVVGLWEALAVVAATWVLVVAQRREERP